MRKPRLLIVDDNRGLLEGLRLALEDTFEVWLAESGETALGLFERALPDIVVTDYRLGGMSGLELARQLLHRRPGLPILFYSAYIDPDFPGLQEAGIKGCINKLSDIQEISQQLFQAVEWPLVLPN